MKSRLHKIEITNFKAFREFTLSLEGRHLLLYGPNGSGKSSLYWALFTFLQSANKPTLQVAKYFDPVGDQKLLNLHEDPLGKPGQIALTLRDVATKNDTTYRISHTDHGTRNQPPILKGDLASDFITYRFFFGFSDFRNSEKFNIWPLFEKEILPFCVSTGAQNPLECWNAIRGGDPNPTGSRGRGGTYSYDEFKEKTAQFAAMLPGIVDTISAEAQKFYDTHFGDGDPAKVNLEVKVTQPPKATGSSLHDFVFEVPVIEFGIQIGGVTVGRPQAYLNEAKLTQLALSVRFAASLVNLHDSDLKLLVLDDLLVSLDMDNRMKVVEILLSPTFANYQKIILTHDLGFFEEFRRVIGPAHSEWCLLSLKGNPKDGITEKIEKSPIERASDYLHGHDLEAAAIQLRKAAEQTADNYLKVATGKAPKADEFHSLSDKLNKARRILENQLPLRAYNELCKNFPEAHRAKLIAIGDNDIDSDGTLDIATKDSIKAGRQKLREFMTHQSWKKLEAYEILEAVIRMKDRVLNPAAHWNEVPLYDAEIKKALNLVQRLESTLLPRPSP